MAVKDRRHQVLAAVRRVFAADVSDDDRRRADAFLQSFQKSSDAIPIALTWLTDDRDDVEAHAQLFLVNTIYRAICSRGSKDMAKYQHRKEDILPVSTTQLVVSCFHQLCTHIYAAFSQPSTPMNMANQFACCVTVCILGSTEAGVLPTLEGLARQERTKTTDPNMLYCVEMAVILVLQLVPEEIHNKRLLLRIDHRTRWENAVEAESAAVLAAVEACWRGMQSHALPKTLHDKMEHAIFQAFATWVEHGHLPANTVANSVLLSIVLDQSTHQLRSGSHHAVEVLVEVARDVVHVCIDMQHLPLIQVLLCYAIHVGRDAIHLDMQLPTDLLLQLVSLVADIGQHALACQALHAPSSESFSFLDVVLSLTAHANTDVVMKLVDFWVDLRESIAQTPAMSAAFDPYVHRAVHVLLRSTEYARIPDHTSEDFYQYRKDIRTVFRSLTQPSLHYQHHFVHELTTLLFDEFAHANRMATVEVYVHALSAMAKVIVDTDDSIVFRILDNLARFAANCTTLNVDAQSLLRTTAVFLSVLHTWAAKNPAALPLAYVILSRCFECSENDPVCPMRVAEDHIGAVALAKISSQCAPHMAPSSSNLQWLPAMRSIYLANSPCTTTTPAIMTDKSLGLILEAYAHVAAVPRENYYDTATPAIVELCGDMFELMETLVPQCRHHDHARAQLTLVLGHLQTLAASLPPPVPAAHGMHPLLHVVQLNWSTLQLIFTHTQSLALQSKVSVLFSTLFRHVGADAASLALVVVPMFMEAFDSTNSRCFLDAVASTLHCAAPDATPDLNRLLILTFSHVASRVSQLALSDDDLVAGVFDFVIVGGTRAPWLFSQASCFEFFFAFAMDALHLGCTNPSLFRFFQATWLWARALDASMAPPSSFQDDVRSFVVPRMPSCFHRLIAVTADPPPTTADDTMDAVAETFLQAAHAFDSRHVEQWMAQVLLTDNSFPKQGVAPSVKKEFVDMMRHPHGATARKLRRLLKQLCKH
ncbi:hypothetical protein DYB32_003139 [Aphanomyces invadans]|uniref:Exportin-1 C-terminal domain-containing protein n=1 Tax=Aphanomyces invadans TaxID=157072 RepID=A0A418B1J1_9STRA|nr:hypothetical protein DYB32_003139 [Aphanomyces invadans]